MITMSPEQVVAVSHLIDDLDHAHADVRRTVSTLTALLADAQHALAADRTVVVAEFLERTIDALTALSARTR